MVFLGIISWKGVSCFNGGVCFSDRGASFLSGGGEGVPHGGGINFGGGGVQKNCKMGGGEKHKIKKIKS